MQTRQDLLKQIEFLVSTHNYLALDMKQEILKVLSTRDDQSLLSLMTMLAQWDRKFALQYQEFMEKMSMLILEPSQ